MAANKNSTLTAENFVGIIKSMSDIERKKLRAEDLIELIIQLEDRHEDKLPINSGITSSIENLNKYCQSNKK